MFGKKKKKKRVCRDCGYISRNFTKRKIRKYGGMHAWDETERQCPECGSKDVKTFNYVLEELVEEKYGKEDKEEPEGYHRSMLFENNREKETDLTEIFGEHHDQKVRLYNLLDKYEPKDLVDVLKDFLEENIEGEEEKKLKSSLAELGYSPGTIKKIMKGDIDG